MQESIQKITVLVKDTHGEKELQYLDGLSVEELQEIYNELLEEKTSWKNLI